MSERTTTAPFELGLDTFGDVTVDLDGRAVPQPQVIRNVVEEAVLADSLGLDFIGVGEHHRDDFAVSAPDVVLADRAHPARLRRDGPQLRRPGAGLPALLHAGRPLRRPAPRSSSAAARSPSRSRCSGTTCRTTSSCSRRSSTCSPSCSGRSR